MPQEVFWDGWYSPEPLYGISESFALPLNMAFPLKWSNPLTGHFYKFCRWHHIKYIMIQQHIYSSLFIIESSTRRRVGRRKPPKFIPNHETRTLNFSIHLFQQSLKSLCLKRNFSPLNVFSNKLVLSGTWTRSIRPLTWDAPRCIVSISRQKFEDVC